MQNPAQSAHGKVKKQDSNTALGEWLDGGLIRLSDNQRARIP